MYVICICKEGEVTKEKISNNACNTLCSHKATMVLSSSSKDDSSG